MDDAFRKDLADELIGVAKHAMSSFHYTSDIRPEAVKAIIHGYAAIRVAEIRAGVPGADLKKA